MRRPLVTVVVAACEGRRWLARALDSVAAQTERRWEAVVVDDASTDGTAELAQRRPGVRLRRRSRRRGAAAGRNLGVSLARGRYVAFLDQDDAWRPRFLEATLAAFDAKTSVVATEYDLMDDAGRVSLRGVHARAPLDPAVHALGLPFLPHISSSLLRREALRRVGPFDESFKTLCDDADFWYRAARTLGPAAFKLVPESLALYRRSRATLRSPVTRQLRGWVRLAERDRARLFELARFLIKHDGWLAAAVPEARA